MQRSKSSISLMVPQSHCHNMPPKSVVRTSECTSGNVQRARRVHWSPLLVQLFRTQDNLSYLVGLMAKLFYKFGKFCASHPWEVMVSFFTLAIIMFTMGPYVRLEQPKQSTSGHSLPYDSPGLYYRVNGQQFHPKLPHESFKHPANSVSDDANQFHSFDSASEPLGYCDCSGQRNAFSGSNQVPLQQSDSFDHTEAIILIISRCMAVLYLWQQFRQQWTLDSKYPVVIALVFTVFSSFIFCTGVVNLLNGNLTLLTKALPFFILLSDFSKASLLAQFALSSSNREEVQDNIARGMSTLGPALTLDTLVETLAIGMGFISGLPRLAEISYFSCMTIVVNYVVFMTFFPAALSLALELMHDCEGMGAPVWQFSSIRKVLQLESENKPNPVIQRVKLIMSAGLMMVHMLSQWATADHPDFILDPLQSNAPGVVINSADTMPVDQSVFSFFGVSVHFLSSTSTEKILVIGFALALIIKYFFFENYDNYLDSRTRGNRQQKYSMASTFEEQRSTKHILVNDSETSCNLSDTTSSSASSTRPTTPTTSTTGDELDNSAQLSKPSTPSIMITTQDSDTESVIEYRRKLNESRMLLSSSTSSSTSSSRAGSVKGLCVHNRNHHHHHNSTSSGHGSDDASSLPASLSECDEDHTQSTAPSFFIGDDCCSECFSTDSTAEYLDREVQTESISWHEYKATCTQTMPQTVACETDLSTSIPSNQEPPRELSILKELWKREDGGNLMSDREIQILVDNQIIPAYKLESALGSPQRGVAIRRRVIEQAANRQNVLQDVPYLSYNYERVLGACCENVIGYMPVPLGIAGPLMLNQHRYYVPMATTEGCLVASTNRGCRAILDSGGVRAKVFSDGMSRGPVLHFRSAMEAAAAMEWLSKPENFELIKAAFDSTSRYARLQYILPKVASRFLFLRFVAFTGDAMGMNMISKGTELALDVLEKNVQGLEMKCLSGNFCTDKKPSSVNWIEGRGKSVVCEATIPRRIVEKVLKTSVDALVELNISKNLIGSAVAGSIGGNNAQAANIVAAIYIATGQDPAQTVGSSNCMTIMEAHGEDLYISCTMPSIEVGTIGGGTVLGPQGACLQLLGLKGCSITDPGSNAKELSMVVCGTVLAAELSLLSALAAGHLVRSHMKHNRSNININAEAAPASFLGGSSPCH